MNKEINDIYNNLIENMKLPNKRYSKPFIIAMCGYTGSGKSIIAKILSSELSLYIVGGDKIRNIYYSNKAANHDINYINQVVNKVTTKEIEYLLKKGISIVIDRSVSSQSAVDDLKKMCNNIIMINLISNHKINIDRITNRKEYNVDTTNCYGDIDSISGVNTEEVYNDILKRKVYNLDKDAFDYEIDTTKSIDSVIEETKIITKAITKKYK